MSVKKCLFYLVAMVAFGFGYYEVPTVINYAYGESPSDGAAVQKLVDFQTQEAEDLKLGQFILNEMTVVHATIDDSKKQILARSVIKVADDIFPSYEDRKTFVTMLAIESKFNRTAKSPTGAVGIAQIIPSFANDHGGPCGIKNLKVDDLYDTDINLAVGACYLRFCLETFKDGNLALAAYNAGHNSKTVEAYAKSGDMNNPETLKYIAKYVFLMQTPDDKKVEVEVKNSSAKHKHKGG